MAVHHSFMDCYRFNAKCKNYNKITVFIFFINMTFFYVLLTVHLSI